MTPRLTALLAAAVVVAAPLAATSPASADSCSPPTITGTEILPGTVVLGTSKAKYVSFQVSVSNGCPVTSVKVALVTSDDTSPKKKLVPVAGGADFTTYGGRVLLRPKDQLNSEAGTWRLKTIVSWSGEAVTNTTEFAVVRAAHLDAKATPATPAAGKTVTVRGKLSRANWQRRTYAGYVGRPLELQFAPTGGSYTAVKTVTSGKGGAVKATTKATVDGCYRFAFAGNSTTDDLVGVPDCVDVD